MIGDGGLEIASHLHIDGSKAEDVLNDTLYIVTILFLDLNPISNIGNMYRKCNNLARRLSIERLQFVVRANPGLVNDGHVNYFH